MIDVEATFTFSGNNYSSPLNISTLTSGVVTSTNIVAVCGVGIGLLTYFSLSSNKTQISCATRENTTGTFTVKLIFYYK